MRRRSFLAWALTPILAVAIPATAACGTNNEPTATAVSTEGGWRALPDSPLSHREQAVGLWTGTEVLLLGGSDAQPCPVNADCPMDPTPLRDGAAVDPGTGRWRRLADAPVPLLATSAVVAGQTAYLLPLPVWDRPAEDEVLAYDLAGDRWRRLPVPFRLADGYALVAVGERVIAYHGSDEAAEGSDYLWDPGTRRWQALPDDPLGPSFDRSAVWTGQEIVMFGRELVANPGAERPSVARAAALDLASGAWRALPDSQILSTAPWLVDGGRLINPTLGGADGGQVGNYGRVYPYGGVLEPATGRWAPLPDPPGVEAQQSAGAFAGATAVYPEADGPVLDTAGNRWLGIPAAPGGEVSGRSIVAAGRDLLVFGGASWASADGTLLNGASVWSPPRG